MLHEACCTKRRLRYYSLGSIGSPSRRFSSAFSFSSCRFFIRSSFIRLGSPFEHWWSFRPAPSITWDVDANSDKISIASGRS